MPLVDLFPLASTPPPEREQRRQAAMGCPWVQCHYPTPLHVCQALLKQQDHAAGIAFSTALAASPAYQAWLQAMPDLKQVPALRAYRNDPRNKWSFPAIDGEMRTHGLELAPHQVLYHGGDLGYGRPLVVGDQRTLDRVLSTTWTPQVALSHTRRMPGRSLLVLSVSPGSAVTAFAFQNRSTEHMGHELEVLVEAGAVLTCTRVHATIPFPTVECSLSR